MIADDASWLQALAMTSVRDGDWQAVTGLTALPHIARIVHESYTYLVRRYPAAAHGVRLNFAVEIEAARHTVKLLDDTQKLYDGVVADFERIAETHRSALDGSRNTAVVSRDGRVFTTGRVADFQRVFGDAGPTRRVPGEGGHAYLMGHDMGAALPSIASALGISWPDEVEMPLPSGPAPQVRTMAEAEFYRERYEPELANAVKDVLTVVESSVNTALYVFAASMDDFVGPVFRARFVSTVHALKALTEITERHPGLSDRPVMAALRDFLSGPTVQYLTSGALRQLRNRCMHYGIPPHLAISRPSAPVYGLVEATTGATYESVNDRVVDTLVELSEMFRRWTV